MHFSSKPFGAVLSDVKNVDYVWKLGAAAVL